jgi:hypothetical protein
MSYLENKRFFADFVLFFSFLNKIFHRTGQFGVRQLYFNNGIRKYCQYFLMKTLLMPSIPGAERKLHFSIEESSSSMVNGESSLSFSSIESLEFKTMG